MSPSMLPVRSSSSPPRGLREAYERIVDEENLAMEESGLVEDDEEEDEEEDDDGPQIDWTREHYARAAQPTPPGSDRRRLERSLNGRLSSRLPVATRRPPGSRSPLPRGDDGRDSDSASVVSGLSGLSGLASPADVPGDVSSLARQARDRQRVSRALGGGASVFSKARVGARPALTAENLRRRDPAAGSPDGTASLASERSDPPLSVPRGWGSKSRKDPSWLSRIRDGEGYAGSPRGRRDGAATTDRMGAAVDAPLPSREDRSSSGTPTAATPPKKGSSPLDRIREWEVDDFTALSLRASTSPPIRTKSATLNRLRQHEIEALKGQAVTTSRLGEIRGRTSKEALQERTAREILQEGEGMGQATSNPARASTEMAEGDYEDRGTPVPGTPVVIYKDSESFDRSMGDEQGSSHEAEEALAGRPTPARHDSHELLRQLARATSLSPSPQREGERETPSERAPSQERRPSSERESAETTPRVDAMQRAEQRDEVNDTPSERAEARERRPARGPQSAETTPRAEAAPVKSEAEVTPLAGAKPAVPAETPDVGIGGWVDTPGTRRRVAAGATSSADLSALRPTPPVSSAVSTSVATARPSDAAAKLSRLKQELDLDNTLDSLDSLLAADDSLLPAGAGASTEGEEDDDDPLDLRDVSPAARARRLEALAAEAMNARLRRLRLGLRDARSGIEGLESRVDQNPALEATRAVWKCPGCAALVAVDSAPHCHHEGWASRLFQHVPTTYTWRDGARFPRLTWFGLVLFIFFLYQLSESALWVKSELYCHPLYASSYEGYGVDVDAPRPPFVTWQILRRRIRGWLNSLDGVGAVGGNARASAVGAGVNAGVGGEWDEGYL
ncbi:MAG: hypothetical protein M1832_001632 [Thelocarpon impressellum]|nr:MAG: hypothetical protein M1832_001632 [Thelocarpon impressellum]